MSCWQPVSMGAAIVSDDGAISIIPLGAPAMKEYPVTEMMVIVAEVVVVIVLLIMIIV